MDEYGHDQYIKDLADPTMSHIKSQEHFEKFYDQLGREPNQLAQQYVPSRTDWIELPPDAHILELGCHAGFNLLHWLSEPGTKRTGTGIDISQPLLDEAERRFAEADKEELACFVKADLADAQSIPNWIWEDTYTDFVLTETLEHVRDVRQVLNAVFDIMLSSEGLMLMDGKESALRLWISAPAVKTGNSSHVRGISESQLLGHLSDIGYGGEIEIGEVNGDTRCKVTRIVTR